MAFRIVIEGAAEARTELARLDDRQRLPIRPLLDVIGQQVAEWGQSRIKASGADLQGTEFAWPPLDPATLAIRRRHGHGGKPILVRGGQLLHSLRVLTLGEDYTEIGVEGIDYARVVQEGGDVLASVPHARGKPRTIPPRPFVAVTDLQLGDLAEMVGAYFAGDDPTPEPARA